MKKRAPSKRTKALLASAAALAAFLPLLSFGSEPGYVPELPPLWTCESQAGASKVRALGPLFEARSSADGKSSLMAFRPLWSRKDAPGERASDFVWPLSAWRDSWPSKFQWVLLYYGVDDPDGRYRHYFIPLWFCGTDEKGAFYWGLWPVYGDVKDLIGYDRTSFALWPLYWRTERNGNAGEAYVWPIVNWESGPRADKFRVFPVYAYNDVYARYYARNVLWPIYESVRSQNDSMPGEGWMLWPFYGRDSWGERSSWSAIWPLFQYAERGESGFRTHCPWPLFQYARSYERDGEYMLWLWPFWGQTLKADEDMSFFVFPLGWRLEDRGEKNLTRWLWLLPLYWTQSVYDKSGEERQFLHRRFWPFASYTETKDSASIRALDIWPQRRMESLERNWSPLWTLFSYDEDKTSFSWDLLWGMLRGSESPSEGSRFAVSPFYDARWGLPAAEPASQPDEIESGHSEAAPESIMENPESVRDVLFGLVRVKKTHGGETRCRLFWSLEF